MNLGRVLLQFPFNHDGMHWQINNEFCLNQSSHNSNAQYNSECYFEPWSNCTLSDALGPGWNKKSFKEFASTQHLRFLYEDGKNELKWLNSAQFANLSEKYDKLHRLPNTITFMDYYDQEQFNRIIPYHFKDLLECSPVKTEFYYYWWRAVSSSFISRPNKATLKWLDDFADIQINSSQKSVGLYIRRGDKAREMKLLDDKR